MVTPTIKRRAKIVRSKTLMGSGYKVRLQQKKRIEPDGSVYNFMLVRWLDPKSNMTVSMYTCDLFDTHQIKVAISLLLTPERTDEMLTWVVDVCQEPRIQTTNPTK